MGDLGGYEKQATMAPGPPIFQHLPIDRQTSFTILTNPRLDNQ
jgi:hypothetical protein